MNRGLTISNFVYNNYVIKKSKNCESFLDLGIGRNSGTTSILRKIKHKYSVGVDIYKPYIDACPEKKIHTLLICSDILEYALTCKDNSFDCILLLDVLEHLPKDKANKVLSEAMRICKKCIIISTPNGFLEQKSYENNPYQTHLSGFSIDELRSKGFKTKRLYGVYNFFCKRNIFGIIGVWNK